MHSLVAQRDDVGEVLSRDRDIIRVELLLLEIRKPGDVREIKKPYHSSILCPSKAYGAARATLTPRLIRHVRHFSLFWYDA